jgi:hypothetical protein
VKVVLFRGKWYDNNGRPPSRASTSLVMDECGIQRVLAKEFMKDNLMKHEPFVFPEDCNQVFLVPDRINKHWQLVVDTEVRRTRPSLPPAIKEVTVSDQPGTCPWKDGPYTHPLRRGP